MWLHIAVQLVLLGFLTQTMAQYGFYNGQCFEEREKYQIVIVLDRTENLILEDARGPLKEVINHLRIKLYYATFALVSFADWDKDAWTSQTGQKRKRDVHEDPEGCYKLEKPFTTRHIEYKSVQDQLDRVQLLPSKNTENIVSAVSWAIVDKKIGWSSDPEMKKVVLLVTDVYDHGNVNLYNPRSRKPSRLDGSDTCSNNLPVKLEEAQKLLKRHKVIIYILLSHNIQYVNSVKDWYKKNTDVFGVPFKISYFFDDKKNKTVEPEELAEDIKHRLDELEATEKGTFPCPD
ncbi:unnamed protein product [Orchesella dallaii]|uniref:VWFA domain-containing protein n=1 Tax=Orchesella dallaii TaxID=48710 RepID=A0ABP1RZZ0_9HEXA